MALDIGTGDIKGDLLLVLPFKVQHPYILFVHFEISQLKRSLLSLLSSTFESCEYSMAWMFLEPRLGHYYFRLTFYPTAIQIPSFQPPQLALSREAL